MLSLHSTTFTRTRLKVIQIKSSQPNFEVTVKCEQTLITSI